MAKVISGMQIYVFSSVKLHHLHLAVEHGIWKVRCDENQLRQRFGKAEGRIFPGDYGVFYLSPIKTLTTPFRFESEVEPTFSDEPFERLEGQPSRFEFRLSSLFSRPGYVERKSLPPSIQKAVTPQLMFLPCEIEQAEWHDLLQKPKPKEYFNHRAT